MCRGGESFGRLWPRDDEERAALAEQGYTDKDYERVYASEEMAQGEGILFAATGITDNAMLRGVRVNKQIAVTHSVVMRSRSRTVRYITAYHDLSRKTIRLHTEAADKAL